MPRAGSGPVSEATNIPLERYSRDEIAVVSGATGTCLSSFAPSARVQPSGVFTLTGGPGGTAPSAGGDPPGGGSASGCAPAEGAVIDTTMAIATTAARR